MKATKEKSAWPIRLRVKQNEVDYILRYEASTGCFVVDIPMLKLPEAVRKLSLKKLTHDTEASINARGKMLILEVLLLISSDDFPVSNPVTDFVQNIREELNAVMTANSLPVADPLQAYFHRQLALDKQRKKPANTIGLAFSRFVTPLQSNAKEISKAAGVLLRDQASLATKMIEDFFPLWDSEQKRQLLARFERYPSELSRDFLISQLNKPHNETYAEGIVTGLRPYQEIKVLDALDHYLQSPKSHSPRTLAAIATWLGKYPDQQAETPLMRLLKSLNLQIAKAAGKALRKRGLDRKVILSVLEKELSSKDLQTRAAAWAVLEDFTWNSLPEQEEIWQRLLANLRQQPEAGVKGMAPAILKYIPPALLLNRIEAGLHQPDDTVKAGMLFLLERLKNRDQNLINEALILRLIPMLESDSFEVRRIIGHLLSGLLRKPLSSKVTTELLAIYERSGGQHERLLTIIGCWVVLFQHNDFDGRVEAPLLHSIKTESRPIMLAAWRLLRNSKNPQILVALSVLRAAGKLRKA